MKSKLNIFFVVHLEPPEVYSARTKAKDGKYRTQLHPSVFVLLLPAFLWPSQFLYFHDELSEETIVSYKQYAGSFKNVA